MCLHIRRYPHAGHRVRAITLNLSPKATQWCFLPRTKLIKDFWFLPLRLNFRVQRRLYKQQRESGYLRAEEWIYSWHGLLIHLFVVISKLTAVLSFCYRESPQLSVYIHSQQLSGQTRSRGLNSFRTIKADGNLHQAVSVRLYGSRTQ